MSEDFKPGTRPLLRLAGLDAERAFVSRDDETHALWAAVVALSLRIHLDPDPASRREKGPSDAQVLGGLRAALAENFGIEAADYLSWGLVVYGCRQNPTLASLHAWERLMFEWQLRRASAPRIALMLRDAGLDKPLKPAVLEAIDGWIADPSSSLGEADAIIAALLGPQLVTCNLHDDGSTPGHDVLFRTLVASLVPAPAIALPRQRLKPGPDGVRWLVEYTHAGVERSFETAANATSLDVNGVMAGVDELLASIGRPERVFRPVPGRIGNGERAVFVLADEAKFAEIAWRLRLPLLRSPTAVDLPVIIAASRRGALRPAAAGPIAAAPFDKPEAGEEPKRRERSPFTPQAEALSVLDSGFSSDLSPPLPREADPTMRGLLTSLRRSFGAGRMLQGSRWMRQSRVEPPSWLRTSADPVAILYEKQEVLFRKGRIGWGALVLADDAVFATGTEDRPALLVYSLDDHFDARPFELGAIASRLAELSRTPAGASEASRFAQQVRNDSGRPLDVPLPASLSTRPVVLTSFMGLRAHLPHGVLAADWFPILTHPSSVIPMMVPCQYWPQALRAAWEAQELRCEPRRRGNVGR